MFNHFSHPQLSLEDHLINLRITETGDVSIKFLVTYHICYICNLYIQLPGQGQGLIQGLIQDINLLIKNMV